MKNHTRIRLCVAISVLLTVPVLALRAQNQQQSQPQPKSQQEQVQPQQPVVTDQSAIQEILRTADPTQRLALVEAFLTTYPQSPYRGNALAAAAGAYREQENFAKAIEYGERALEINPRDTFSLILVADSLSEGSQPEQSDFKEKMQKAEEYSHRALAILPEFFAALQRDPNVPVEQYKLQQDYLEAQVHATLGYIHFRRDDLAAAEEELQMATDKNQLSPNSADFERLGIVQLKEKKYEQARASFQRCIQAAGLSSETCRRRLELLETMIQQEQPKPETKPQE